MITQSAYPNDPRVRRQAEVLNSAGIETDIICLKLDGQADREIFGLVTAVRILKNERQEKMIPYVLQTFVFFIKAFIEIQKLYKKRKYSIIQIHNMPDFHVFIAVLQKIAGVPVVLDIHDLTPELFSSKWSGFKHKILKSVVESAEKISCKFSSHVITVAPKCKEILVSRGVPPDKVTLVLNTPNKDIFNFDAGRRYEVINDNAKLMYHGTVAERFGLHLAVEALPAILKKIPGSTLNIYGKYDSSYQKRLENLIKDMGLEKNVFLNGRLTFEEIYKVIQKSDFGVVPYVNNEYMNLALSTKTFEYAACGLPVVATRLESLALTFPDNSLTYVSDNSAEIAEKIIRLCRNPEERKSKAFKALEVLEDISWDVMSVRYLNLMRSLIKEKAYVYPDRLKETEEAH